MPAFAWQAYDQRGRVVRGTETARDLDDLVGTLRDRSLHPFRFQEKADAAEARYGGKISASELIHFTEQLAIVIRSGIPILSGIDEIAAECTHPGFKIVLEDIHRRIEAGERISKALESYPRIFNSVYVNVVAAGEETGSLEIALERMAHQMTWVHETKRQVRGALIQPAALLVAVIGLTILVITTFVPKVTELLSRSGQELPGITAALVAASDVLRNHWMILLGVVGGSLLLMRTLRSFEAGRLLLHGWLLRFPVIGRVLHHFAVSRFVNIFNLLNSAGVTVVHSLELTEPVPGNAVICEGVRNVRKGVENGEPLADAMHRVDVFPSLVLRMVRIGEQSGELDIALQRVSSFYDKEIPRALKRITTVLQPALMLLSAAIVAFVVFAAFMPMVSLVKGMR